MKKLKDEKFHAIAQAARCEFFNKGFKEASMRVIARKANVSLSNIYNYFTNKDEMFAELVKPAKEALYTFIKEQHSGDPVQVEMFFNLAYRREMIDSYIHILETYREEIRLLLFKADGSSFEGFRDELTDYLATVSAHQADVIQKHYPHAKRLSELFMRILSSWMVTIVGEMVTHPASRAQVREFFLEFFRFEIAGWREVIEL